MYQVGINKGTILGCTANQISRQVFQLFHTGNFCTKQPRVQASEVMGGGWLQGNEKVEMAIWEW